MVLDARRQKAHERLAKALDVTSPFPWQLALLDRFLEGRATSAIDVPTGLGKTAVMAIWLVARAAGAAVPRRLVYVVDRRAVVDQATAFAEKLCALVSGDLELQHALGLDGALPISTLRGKHLDNRQWLVDPSVPAMLRHRGLRNRGGYGGFRQRQNRTGSQGSGSRRHTICRSRIVTIAPARSSSAYASSASTMAKA